MQPLFSRLLRRSPSLHHHLLNPNSSPKPNLSHLHLLRSLSSSSAADSESRRYAGYFILILGCGAATYYSFPLPTDAKHKKAQIFKYAPLPDDLHTVSNWSGTHEVATRVFIQPESIPDLEKAVKEADTKRQRIRPVGSGLSPNGIGLSRLVNNRAGY
jgi:L-galactono-1,4-lactone dehydrogenase